MKGKILCVTFIVIAVSFVMAHDSSGYNSMTDASILGITDEGDYLWVGAKTGVTRLHKTTGEISYYINSIPGMMVQDITSMAVDNQGHPWVGTLGEGVGQYDGENWMVYNTGNSGLTQNRVTAIDIDSTGNIWIGTPWGLFLFDGENWTGYNISNSDLPFNRILSVACDDTGTVWIGTDGGGLAKFDGENWEVYDRTNSDLPNDDVNALAIDSQGYVWIGTGNRLAKFDGNNWIVYDNKNSELPTIVINDISCDPFGNAWIITNHYKPGYGLVQFTGENSTEYNKNNSDILIQKLQCVCCDEQGNAWVGTDGGLMRYNGENWEVFKTGSLENSGTWETKRDIAGSIAWLTSSVVKGKIYVIGGYTGGTSEWRSLNSRSSNAIDSNKEYDPAIDTWTPKKNMPTARNGMGSCTVDGIIYVIGGFNNSFSHVVEAYDPVTDTWTQKADMPTGRWEFGVVVINGKIYVIGGGGGSSTVEEYDPVTDTWAKKADMPTKRHTLTSGALNGIIYAIGGWMGSNSTSIVEAYDPATDSWSRKADMKIDRGAHAASVTGGKIYVIGGASGSYDANYAEYRISSVEVFDLGFDEPTFVENSVPAGFSLSPNYPNPFNPKTTISYQLDTPGMVTVVIFDLLGRKVSTLVEEMKMPGNHSVTWNAEGFASGVYFYRIKVGDSKVLTRKMMLVK